MIGLFDNNNEVSMVAGVSNNNGKLVIDDERNKVSEFRPEGSAPFLDCGTKVFRDQILQSLEPNYPFDLESRLWPTLIRSQRLSFYKIKSKGYSIDNLEKLNHFRNWMSEFDINQNPFLVKKQ